MPDANRGTTWLSQMTGSHQLPLEFEDFLEVISIYSDRQPQCTDLPVESVSLQANAEMELAFEFSFRSG